ncbi:hypothetical protein [Mucilaginibacter pedocola]|uniref:Uncharacterized protein n=1 Tax=Mucilaginibacter pedocola TaxID=1792845 RepID=A0A1S9P6D5_9SPHI|nr:hypothetical protein [Mucilaginibacter pedocola]OOQ56397.1 hypothetical protein BC343_18265 [Mucilaginibacter pedocola]
MNGQEFKILFRQDKAFLIDDKPILLEKAGLSNILNIEKKEFKHPAYWTIRVINHNESEKKIYCEVLAYHIGETEFEQNQKQLSHKLNDIEIITFRNLDTAGLLTTLSGKGSGSFYPSKDVVPDRVKYPSIQSSIVNELPAIEKHPYKRTLTETFFVQIKNVRFILGGVSFDKKLQGHYKLIEFTISNHDIREEFDAVKNYFANVPKTKEIQVTAVVEFTDDEITSSVAKSSEIEQINNSLIDNVKFEFVRETKKKTSVDIDKNLFTMDEYFETFAEVKIKKNPFYDNEKDFINDLLKISNTKHYKQLRFLSSQHLHDIMKLRFIQKPFSFIFLIQGDKNYHVVWETLDTEEATYIWQIPKNPNVLKSTMRKLEDMINLMKIQGKRAYINAADESFRRINHDYSNLVDGFVKWKGDLESYLK